MKIISKIITLKLIKKTILILCIILAILSILIFSITEYYIHYHKKEIKQKIEHLLNESLVGEISFDDIEISSLKKFPNLSIKIKNIKLVDSLYNYHHRATLENINLIASVSVINTFKKKIKFNRLEIYGGNINFFEDENGYRNLYVFNTKKSTDSISQLRFVENETYINLENSKFSFIDKRRHKRITADINKIDAKLNPFAKIMNPKIHIDLKLHELGFNLRHGVFLQNTDVQSDFQPEINTTTKIIDIKDLNLILNNHLYRCTTSIDINQKKYTLNINSENLNFHETLNLLTKNIQTHLSDYKFSGPIDAACFITGYFYSKNPYIKIDFKTKKNKCKLANEKITITDINFDGYFINRWNILSNNDSESTANYILFMNTMSGKYKNNPFTLNQSMMKGTDTTAVLINANLTSNTNAESINKLIISDEFIFKNGAFEIKSNINGWATYINEVLKISNSEICVSNTDVELKSAEKKIPIKKMLLQLENENTFIKNLNLNVSDSETIKMNGSISNFSSLFFTQKKNLQVQTILNVNSKRIDFEKLLSVFTPANKNKKEETEVDTYIKNIKKTLDKICSKFNPSLSINFDTLNFYNNEINNVYFNLDYKNKEINIDSFVGYYKNGGVNSSFLIDLKPMVNKEKKELLHFEYNLNAYGEIEKISELLNSDTFFFKNAKYTLNSSYKGTTNSYINVINNTQTNLHVGQGNLYYKTMNLNIPFEKIDLEIIGNKATCKNFIIEFPSSEKLNIKGDIENFTSVFIKNDNYKTKTFLHLFSKNFSLEDFLISFIPKREVSSIQKEKKNEIIAIKNILNYIYRKFNPNIEIKIDNFSYKKLLARNVNSKIYFKNNEVLKFENFDFKFYGKEAKLSGLLDMTDINNTRFTCIAKLNKFDLNKLLKTFNNFNFKNLDSPFHAFGDITTNAYISGNIIDSVGIDEKSINARIYYKINDLTIENFEPLIKAGDKIFKKERFEKIKFNGIEDSVFVKNATVYIPTTALFSTAMRFYINGHFDNKNNALIWMAVPYNNLISNNYKILPKTEKYKAAGSKFYLKIKSNKSNTLDYHFFSNKNKFIKAENILMQNIDSAESQ